MFTRISIALIALALLAPTNLLAGYRETQRSESLKKFRGLCVTVVSRSSDSSTKSQAARYLELSRLRSWSNAAGKTIHASYLGHGTNAQGQSVIYLEKPDGIQYAVKPVVLSAESQMEADELKWLIPAITRDAQRLEDEFQARRLEEEQARLERERINRARVGVSASFASYSVPTVEPNPVVYRTLYQPRTYRTSIYSASPYYPWARLPFITVGGHFSGHHGSGHHGSGHHMVP
jgi:hypothetical protein